MTFYAFADVHGHKAGMDRALRLIAEDGGADAPLVILGDLVDRGPDSRGVIETVVKALDTGRDWTVIRGNHDQLFLDVLGADATPDRVRRWTGESGGAATLGSYGLDAEAAIAEPALVRRMVPRAHRALLASLPHYRVRDGYLFVHAGIAPGVPLDQQQPQDMLHIREPFLDFDRPHPWMVLHGHTPLERPQHFGNRINLDGGAGHGRPLVPAVFEGGEGWLLTEAGRAPLRPPRR